MSKELTDNEWAAEFLGYDLVHVRDDGALVCCYDMNSDETAFEWRPDSDLNQFKLVLDRLRHKCDQGYEILDQAAGLTPGEDSSRMNKKLEDFYLGCIYDPASALKAIRQVAESPT